MSTAQTYLVAHAARAKLSREAARPDHNLRLLVGHANLLDSLMYQLAESEREQESWFNATVADHAPKEAEQHIRWVDTIQEEAAEDDSDSDEEDIPEVPLRRQTRVVVAHPLYTDDSESDSEEEEEDEEEDLESLALVRTHSHSLSPPALVHDESDSEDEDGPASPPQQIFERFSSKKESAPLEANFFHDAAFFSAPAVSAF